jgi:UPF0755 protein
MAANRKRKRSPLLWIGLLILALGLFAAYKVFGPNTGQLSQGEYLYIRTGATYEDVRRSLQEGDYLGDMWSFELLAKQAGYPARVKAGKYKINRGMSNYNIVRVLRSGRQTPVKLVINKVRTKQDIARLIGTQLEADSNKLLQLLSDSAFCAAYGQDTNTIMCAIIPDTYEFYWNTNAEKAFSKIQDNYKAFWNDNRKQLAAAKKLSLQQITIIASIVEEETNMNDEKGNVASVYINRYNKGMRLQADPTVKFAVGDFTLRRITGVHLQTLSPYNTYLNSGLPPGPICTPSKKTLDAVLNSPSTDYIYFCAKEDFSGYHRFASNYNDHMKNARLYQQALDARGIH